MPSPALTRALPIIASLALLAGCQSGDTPPSGPRTVLVHTVGQATTDGAGFTGEIRARHEVDLAFRVAGKLAARLVDAGAEIRAGQPLARLDPADLQLAAAAAQAQLAAAESELSTTKAERERYAGLLARKFVSQAAFDAKDNAYNSARGRREQAAAQTRISANQAAYGTLSSEFPAVVTAVLAEAGQVVGAGQAVLRVARPEEKEVAIAVPESRVAELKNAKALGVALWAEPQLPLQGELRELAPAADPATRTYAARIRILQPPPDVRLGMTARVTLGQAEQPPLQVPLGAVVDQGKGAFVWIVADGKAMPRPVQVARFREDGALIEAGLQPGEQVVVAGTAKLVAGQAVQAQAVTPSAGQR